MHEARHGHDNVVIVGHGVTNRAFEMSFFQHPVDWFERSVNPGNSDVTLIEGTRETGYTSRLLIRRVIVSLARTICERCMARK